jgi:anti-sigma regulatory factor (Ser/Thr protein kinase)
MAHHLSLTLRNHRSEISRLVDRIEAFGAEASLLPDVTFRLTLALDEIVSNVIRHAFDDGAQHSIEVRLDVANGVVTATVEDDGVPFDPRDAPAPALDAPLEERQAGGLGMHLVRSTMDEIDYRRDGDRNVLTVRTAVAGRERAGL